MQQHHVGGARIAQQLPVAFPVGQIERDPHRRQGQSLDVLLVGRVDHRVPGGRQRRQLAGLPHQQDAVLRQRVQGGQPLVHDVPRLARGQRHVDQENRLQRGQPGQQLLTPAGLCPAHPQRRPAGRRQRRDGQQHHRRDHRVADRRHQQPGAQPEGGGQRHQFEGDRRPRGADGAGVAAGVRRERAGLAIGARQVAQRRRAARQPGGDGRLHHPCRLDEQHGDHIADPGTGIAQAEDQGRRRKAAQQGAQRRAQARQVEQPGDRGVRGRGQPLHDRAGRPGEQAEPGQPQPGGQHQQQEAQRGHREEDPAGGRRGRPGQPARPGGAGDLLPFRDGGAPQVVDRQTTLHNGHLLPLLNPG